MPTSIIKLNVGGKAFLTSRQTVEREPDSMLARMCLGDLGSYEVGIEPHKSLHTELNARKTTSSGYSFL